VSAAPHTPVRHEPLPLLDVVIVPYIAVVVGMYLARSVWIAFWLYEAGMVAVLAHERQWFRLRDLWRSKSAALAGAAVATLVAGPVLYALAVAGDIGPRLAEATAVFGPSAGAWPLFIACFCLTNPWLEELYWRGYLGEASTRWSWRDVLFAGYHPLFLVPFVGWWWALAAFVLLVVVARLWRQAARLGGGLLVPVISHFAADLSILLASWVLISRS